MTDLHLSLDRSTGRLSAQIAAGVRTAIRGGRLGAGTRLPSSRDLARDLDVSRGVVVAAFEQLIAEGFLLARRGDGTRVAPLARVEPPPDGRPGRPCEQPLPDSMPYDMRPGKPDLAAFPRERWLGAMRAALRDMPHADLDYPDPGGAPVLRVELAGYLGRVRAAHVTPEMITIMSGVSHGLSALLGVLAADGYGALALEDPTSPRQLPMIEASGLELPRVPVDDEGVDVAALVRTGARAVLLTPAHQYPTGVVLSPRRRAALISWARDVDGIVLEDDYDAEFRYDREPVGCLQGVDPARVVLLGSVSKALVPGLRLGWVAGPRWVGGRLREHRTFTDLGGPVLEQHALAHLIHVGGYDRHLRAMRRQYRSRRDALAAALEAHLPGCRVQGVSAGLHLYVVLRAGLDEGAVVAAAAELGVGVAGAAEMWSRRPPAPALVLGYARLSESRLVVAAELLGRAVAEF